jgi:serine/threonine protein kinase
MLKKFSGDSHTHLVSLLATYEQFKRFYLVFHWAEADLLDYWKDRNPTPSVDQKTILWMAEQCKGIANGLSKIHHYESSGSKVHSKSVRKLPGLSSQNLAPPSSHAPTNSMEQLYGRHGDIKPANVLLFSDTNEHDNIGTLKLTDFGLAEFSALHSRSYKPKSKVAASPSYRPPECDLHDGVIGRSYDIWTLGCLYLEFITWLLGGWELVEEFTAKRTTFDTMWHDMPTDTFFEIVKCSATGTPGAMIKPAVTNVRHTPPNSHSETYLRGSLVYLRPPRPPILY